MSVEPETLPISLLTGFLGSGKTTFLQRALADAALTDTAVLVNELGEVGLDHHLVETVDGPLLELPGGCLCCAVREDLASSLRDLLDRRLAGKIHRFQRVVIETTGLADPAPILYTLGADPVLDGSLHLARVVTTIDAVSGAASLARFPEAARQAALADLLLVTKTDLATPDAALAAALDALNADAPRLSLPAELDAATLLFGALDARRPAPPVADTPAAHSHGITTAAIRLATPVGRLDFARALGELAQRRGEDLLRVKGLVAFADRPGRPAVIQGAQHAIYPPAWLDAWPAGEDPQGGGWLVFITAGIPLDEIVEAFGFAGATAWLSGASPFAPQRHAHHHDHDSPTPRS